MDNHKPVSLSFAAVLASSLLTFSSVAQVSRTATIPTVNANPVLPWALGIRVPLVTAGPPTVVETVPAILQWTRTTNNPPVNLGTILLLTDGTVIAHEENDQNGNVATTVWYKLTPDINGSYINGTWSQIASLPAGYGPLFFGSAVLPDGRVVVEGGEYNQYGGNFSKLGAIYDPVANTWKMVTAPTGWNSIDYSSTVVLSKWP